MDKGKLKKDNDAIFTFEINHNNHVRKIVTYSSNKIGNSLRRKHEIILNKMKKFPSNSFSFAYKENSCTRNALLVHDNSNMFIKLDIHDYFNSITLESLLKNYKPILNIFDISEKELNTCFIDGHLPLGFVTSPKISDLYLYYFDNNVSKFLKEYPNLKYSRYCDDILISIDNNDFALLHKFESFIRKELKGFGLEINDSKRREFDLEKDTSVSFLGLNLSKKDGISRITISKRFLLWTLDLIQKFNSAKAELKALNENNRNGNVDIENSIKKVSSRIKWLRNIILSRVSYIQFNSETSYKRFLNKHKNKFNKEWSKWCLR